MRELESQLEQMKPRLLALSRRYQGDLMDAEDAVCETFEQVILKISEFEGRSSFSTWVYAICLNKNREILRKKNSYSRKIKKLASSLTSLFSHQDHSSLLRQDLQEALNQLEEREKNVFLLSVFEEMPQKEIAVVMDLSVANVKVILFRARKKLAEIMG